MTRRAALALLGGLLMALSFPLGPPLPSAVSGAWWVAGWVCLAPLIIASLSCRSAAGAGATGLAYGLVAYTLMLAWMHPFLVRWAYVGTLSAAGIVLLLASYVSLYAGAFAVVIRFVGRRLGVSQALLIAPFAWAGLELARDRLLTGFPWGLLGYTQQSVLPCIQVADLAGVYGVSFLLACGSSIAAGLTLPVFSPGTRPGRAALLLPAAAIGAGLAYGAARLSSAPSVEDGLPVALIQANVPQEEKWDPAERDRIEREHVAMTRRAAENGARLVVWSESSIPISLTQHPDYAARLSSLAKETGSDLLVGSVAYEEGPAGRFPYNSVFSVVAGQGVAGRYDKRKLVPFGEYVPLKKLLFFLEPLVEEASDFHAGDPDGGILRAAGVKLGILICYEAIFPELARREAGQGAGVLVNMTNDAWYGDSAMPRQHLAQAVLRAVENRRFLLRCANTGISAVVEPSGRIRAEAALDQPAILSARVSSSSRRSVYTSIGDGFAWGCVILTLLAMARAWRVGPDRPNAGPARE